MNNVKNFKVFQASAGSGKTYTIIKEYLKLCLGNESQTNNYRHILAITFTNASANDMKAKIKKKLEEIINSTMVEDKTMENDLIHELGISDSELKKNAQTLLTKIIHDYSSFCVCTIDAFVQKISRSFARDLNLPMQYSVSIDSDDIAETIADNLGMQISDDNKFFADIMTHFFENQFQEEKSYDIKSAIINFIKKLMSEKAFQRNNSGGINNEMDFHTVDQFLQEKTKRFIDIVTSFLKDFDRITKEYHLNDDDFSYGKNGLPGFIKKLRNRIYELPGSNASKTISGNGWASKKAKDRFSTSEIDTIESELSVALKPFVTEDPYKESPYKAMLGEYLFYSTQRNMLYLYALQTQIKNEAEKLAEEEDLVHISEFNKLISNVLGDFSVPFIYERIGEHFKHIFIDEFQDTSILQWQNLLPLIDNGLSNGNMNMIVGDGKQSIYRFRSGEVEQIVKLPEIYALPTDERKTSFEQFQKTLKENFMFTQLESNYRSKGEIVKFNNAFFTQCIGLLSDDSKKVYIDNDELYKKSVKIEQTSQKDDGGFVEIDLYPVDAPQGYYLDRIVDIINDLVDQHKYQYSDIAILTRKNDVGTTIANHLNEKQIPIISSESILLKSSDKVLLIINTLRYFIERDNMAVIANMLFFRKKTTTGHEDNDTNGYFEAVADIASGAKDIETAMGIGKPELLHETLSHSTNLYDLCSALVRIYGFDATSDSYINYLLENMFRWQSSGKDCITDFIQYWDNKKNNLAVESVSGNAIKIMTIHKSKGLEFKVVIYPGAINDLNERIGGASKTPEVWKAPEDLGFSEIPKLEKISLKLDKQSQLQGKEANKLFEEEAEANRLDNCNLLYVAFTRPKERLYIMAKESKDSTNDVFPYFLGQESVDANVEQCEGYESYQFGDPSFNSDGDNSKDSGNDICKTTSCDWFPKIIIDPTPSMFWASGEDMKPNEWGDLVHEILSHVQTADDIEEAIKPYLLEGHIDNATAAALRDKFRQIVNNEDIKDAFCNDAIVKNECEILANGEILRPDRFAELQDRIYLLDYKTGKKEEKHHKQLKDYIAALQPMTEKDICAFLVYIGNGLEVEKVILDTLF